MSTRENVLKALEENKGSAVSGGEMANRLNITRSAVWKAIRELRKEGYRIDAVTNKGYILAPDSDVLSAEGILPYVNRASIAGRIHVFKSLESTNLTAKKMALDGATAGTVVIAEEQTKGRGRMGRSFFSPPTGGIYMSFILRPSLDNATSVLITAAASVAVCKAVEKVTGIICGIKWVNDIYKGKKKVCGILTEAVTDFESGTIDHIVLGLGINYSTPRSAFPAELACIAGSLFEDAGTGVSPGGVPPARNRLIAEVINQVLDISDDLEAREFIREYRDRSFVLGKEILIIPASGFRRDGDPAEGIPAAAVDIDENGGLVVRHLDGRLQTLRSGEISIREMNRRRYRLIVTDLDRTLLRDDNTISDYTKAVLQKVSEQGIQVMLATGRFFGGGRKFARELNLNTPILACNGALIKEAEGTLLYGKPIRKNALEEIFRLLTGRKLTFHCYGEDAIYTKKLTGHLISIYSFNNELPEEERFPIMEFDPADLTKLDEIYKVLVHCEDEEDKKELLENLTGIPGTTVTVSWEDTFDILADQVSKSAAIDRYAREKGIDRSEIICFGDYYNDIDMVRFAGLGIAVENGVDEIKKAADYVTCSNNDDGVAKAIEKFLFNK